MNAKIKPATPLPWRFEQHNGDRPTLYRGEPSYQPAYIYGIDEQRICGFKHMPNDAAYIVHAANSLPRLEAERAQLVKAVKDARNIAVRPDFEQHLTALLRSLGEE